MVLRDILCFSAAKALKLINMR